MLLLDEIAGGLNQHECEDLVALIKRVHASGVTIVWIEHVLHALMSVVARALVLYQGQFIADGDAARRHPATQGRGDLYGHRSRCLTRRCSDRQTWKRSTATSRRSTASTSRSIRADRRDHRRQRRGQEHAAEHDRRPHRRAARRDRVRGRQYRRRCRPIEIVTRGLALVPEGRRLFPSLSVEENLLIGGQVGRPGAWTLARVYELFPILCGAPRRAGRRAIGRTAADGRHRPRADVQSETVALRRTQPRPRADRRQGDLRAYCARSSPSGVSAIIVEQDIQQALKIANHVYCMLEGRIVLEGAAGALTREAIAAAYFGV